LNKRIDILGVKTYPDTSYIFSGGQDSPTPEIYAPGDRDLCPIGPKWQPHQSSARFHVHSFNHLPRKHAERRSLKLHPPSTTMHGDPSVSLKF